MKEYKTYLCSPCNVMQCTNLSSFKYSRIKEGSHALCSNEATNRCADKNNTFCPIQKEKQNKKTSKQINKTFNYHSMKSVRKNKILSFSCCKCCAVCNICWSTFVTLTGCRCCHMLAAVTRSLRKTQSIEKNGRSLRLLQVL